MSDLAQARGLAADVIEDRLRSYMGSPVEPDLLEDLAHNLADAFDPIGHVGAHHLYALCERTDLDDPGLPRPEPSSGSTDDVLTPSVDGTSDEDASDQPSEAPPRCPACRLTEQEIEQVHGRGAGERLALHESTPARARVIEDLLETIVRRPSMVVSLMHQAKRRNRVERLTDLNLETLEHLLFEVETIVRAKGGEA